MFSNAPISASDIDSNIKTIVKEGVTNGNIYAIRLLSKHVCNKLSRRNCNITVLSESINHDKYFDINYWKYIKKVINKTTAILPSSNKASCFAFLSKSLSALKPNKRFAISDWNPKFAYPKAPFNLALPTYL